MKTFTIENETNNVTVHPSEKKAEAILDSARFSDEAALAALSANWPTFRLIGIWNSLPGATPVSKFKDRKTAVSRIWKAIQNLGEALPQGTAEGPRTELVARSPQAESVAAEPKAIAPEPGVPGPEADVTAPLTPQTAHVEAEEAPATNEATTPTDAPVTAPSEKLLRILENAMAGLSPEQREQKWEALRNALAARKAAAPRKAEKTEAARDGSKTSQVIAMLKREGGVTVEEIMTTMEWQKHTTRALLSAGGSLVKKHGLVIVSEKVGDKRVYSIKA